MSIIINEESVDKTEAVLQTFIDKSGATYVLLADMGPMPKHFKEITKQ